MDLTLNSALDPVADGLLVELEQLGDLGHREELVVEQAHEAETYRRLLDEERRMWLRACSQRFPTPTGPHFFRGVRLAGQALCLNARRFLDPM
jgi:hypothetical protein